MEAIIFWVAAVLSVVAAVRVITLHNPVASVLHLIVTLVCLAVIFLQLSAEFIAILQVIVYGGAIMVLFLFVVMLLNLKKDEFAIDPLWGLRFLGGLAGLVLLAELVFLLGGFTGDGVRLPVGFGSVEMVGHALFGDYLFPFELTSILLLGAAIAVVVVARDKAPNEPEEQP